MSQIADANGSGRLLSPNDVHHVSGSPGTGKSHLAQAILHAAIQQGYRVLYRETHILLDELAETTIDGTRKEHFEIRQQHVEQVLSALVKVAKIRSPRPVSHYADT
jgi:chromosomal replication initiation ATPase DnaA